MTSALQVLCILRSPSRRSQEPIAALESDHPDPEPDVRGSRRDRRRGRRGEDGDQSRGSHGGPPKGRHPKSCGSGSHMEREVGRSSRNGSEARWPGNSSNGGVSNNMLTHLGITRNDQLPGAVEDARKRLLERLRSVSLTDTRRRVPNDHILTTNESALGDGFDINNANLNHEISISNTELTISKMEKTPALRWDAFSTTKGEIFSCSGENYEGGVKAELTECCICLEGFKDGDLLIKLRCSHKFHPDCLEPWVRSSRDCPLCRADIV